MKQNLFVSLDSVKNKENPYIDVFKIVISYFVVCIHTDLFLPSKVVDSYFLEGLFRIAVPMFFVIAGYFLFTKAEISDSPIKEPGRTYTLKYIKRIFMMYVLWGIPGLFFRFFQWYTEGESIIGNIPSYIFGFFVRGESAFYQFWYLAALYTGAFLVFIFNKKFRTKTILIIASVLYAIGLLLLPYYIIIKNGIDSSAFLTAAADVYYKYIVTPRNGLTFGFVFVAIGAMFAQKQKIINFTCSIIGTIASLMLLFGEVTLLRHIWVRDELYGGLQISLIPLVYFMFSLLMNLQIKYPKNGGKKIRNMSTIIYCVHVPVLHIFGMLSIVSRKPFVLSLSVYAVSVVISLIWIKIEKFKPFKFMKYLR